MSEATRWWWVRHAPVVAEWRGRIYGDCDVPAEIVSDPAYRRLALHLPEGALLVTSHLGRTKQTAAALEAAGWAQGDRLAEEVALAEQNLGRWEGWTHDELERRDGIVYRAFWRNMAGTRAPGGESFVDVCARVAACVERLTREHASRDIVAIAHAGSIRAAYALAAGAAPESALAVGVANLSLSRFDHVAGAGWRVVTIGAAPP